MIQNDDGQVILKCNDRLDEEGTEEKLNYGESFKFECETSMFRQALCKCEVKWGDEIRFFDAYNSETHKEKCGRKCLWHLTNEGPSLMGSEGSIEEFKWGEQAREVQTPTGTSMP